MPKHLVPDGFLTAGENVLCRDGVVLVRPGMQALTTAPSASRVMGGIYYQDHTQTDFTIIGTKAGFHSFDGSSWSAITGTPLTGGDSNQVRFAPFLLAGSTKLLAVNDVDAPQVYTGSGNFADLAGSPPIAKAVCVAFQRVILANVTVSGTRHASGLWVSGFQDPTSWNAADEANLPDTGDTIVEVKALSDQAFAIYKDRSQWVGIGAGNLFPFVFELRSRQVGPTSPACVVQAEDAHYYIGQDGDVYKFDGNRCEAIGGRVRRLIQADLDFSKMAQVNGFFDELNREIWWFWPSFRATGSGGIVYRLPYGDVPGAFSPLMVYANVVSASFLWKDNQQLTWDSLTGTWDELENLYPTWDSFPQLSKLSSIVGLSDGQVSRFGRSGGDNGTNFSAYFDLPFRPLTGDGQNVRVSAVESFFKKTFTETDVSIVLYLSDNMNDDGTAADTQEVDISTESGKLRVTYYNKQARFVAIRHRLTNVTGLQEYRGGVIYVYRRGEGHTAS